ncbi:sensor histidine kinase [Tenacibaculum amylolyticum]|uniref:sensor histidine kinase n=1 Tax=Tenacibaculum amylolyticum TaxID=104269 RepID=UPI0038955A26
MITYKKISGWPLTICAHILFWFGVYLFYTYYIGYGTSNIAYINHFAKFLIPITMGVGYFFLYFLLPRYLFKKKYFFFILYAAYTFIISFFFIVLSILYGMVFSYEFTDGNAAPLTKTVPYIVFGVYFIVLIIVILGLIIHNYQSNLKSEDLKNRFLETQLQLKEQELKYLKMQIHPHFLFNTLNTIYGFALKKSEKTPEVILKLSSLLDYILYQINKPFVLLEDEIQHIEDYISLEKIRFQEGLQISFSKENLVPKTLIPPMLLLPFVENAFKHGIPINKQLTIQLSIKTKEQFLHFSCKNTAFNTKETTSGIGLTNIKERLRKLFDNNFELQILEEKNTFSIDLKIPLKNE